MSPLAAIEMIEKKEMGFADFVKKRGNEGNAIEKKGSDDIRDLKVVARKFTTILALLAHADHITRVAADMKKTRRSTRQCSAASDHSPIKRAGI
ncbi:hypothetical protein GCM10020331_077720 [Ectobacillus funiculus]